MDPITLLVTAFSLTVFFLAVWRGGAPERAGGAVLFAAFLVDEVYHSFAGPPQYARLDLFELVLDAISLAAFAWLTVRANRLWPIMAAALQLLAVIGHLVVLTGAGMQRAYWAMTEPPVFLGVLTLLVGLLLHWRRERRRGMYPDWRPA